MGDAGERECADEDERGHEVDGARALTERAEPCRAGDSPAPLSRGARAPGVDAVRGAAGTGPNPLRRGLNAAGRGGGRRKGLSIGSMFAPPSPSVSDVSESAIPTGPRTRPRDEGSKRYARVRA